MSNFATSFSLLAYDSYVKNSNTCKRFVFVRASCAIFAPIVVPTFRPICSPVWWWASSPSRWRLLLPSPPRRVAMCSTTIGPGCGHSHGHCGRHCDLGIGRQSRANRRPDGGFHRHHLRGGGAFRPFGAVGATMMAGLFLVLLGVFRLGSVIKFIPYPIVVGFTSGIALTIFTTQVQRFPRVCTLKARCRPVLSTSGCATPVISRP